MEEEIQTKIQSLWQSIYGDLKKKRGHKYAKRTFRKKKSMDASVLLFLQLFDKKKKMTSVRPSERAADSGFVGLVKWGRRETDKKPQRLICFQQVEEPETAVMYSPIMDISSAREAQPFSRGDKGPQLQQCFHHWATNVLVWYIREKWHSTSASPPPPSKQLLRFDFNAFCVVLYFHAKSYCTWMSLFY